MSLLNPACLFCRIIRSEIPCHKIYETSTSLAFLDIHPLSVGHILVIPKAHGERLHHIPDEYLADTLIVAKKIGAHLQSEADVSCRADGVAYNILQNNGRLAHQEVNHVHFHLIPKRSAQEGLGIKWDAKEEVDHPMLAKLAESYRAKLA